MRLSPKKEGTPRESIPWSVCVHVGGWWLERGGVGGMCVSEESTDLHVSRCVCARVSQEDVCRVSSAQNCLWRTGGQEALQAPGLLQGGQLFFGGRWKGRGGGELTLNLESRGHCLLRARGVF